MNEPLTNHDAPPAMVASSYGRRLLHRWLVEYNPLYLTSAMLVLGGMILTSRGLAHEGSLYGEIGVAAIAEVYAAALIGGAALLTRIGHRRPAVMLALLTVLYQWDLTLHTETCAYLGAIGVWAMLGWLALFVAKLRALAWAMKLSVSRTAMATASLGALGLAVLPHYLQRLELRGASALVAVWLFALGALWALLARPGRDRGVASVMPLDAWGETVLRRSVRAAWLMSALLLAGHVLFWSTQHSLSLTTLLFVAPLLTVRRARTEARAWVTVAGTLAMAGVLTPGSFAVTALLAAAALALRALPDSGSAETVTVAPTSRAAGPYRVAVSDLPFAGLPRSANVAAAAPAPASFVPIVREERVRLLAGALSASYLFVWTVGWSGGSWPAHVAWLDVVLTVVALSFVLLRRARLRVALPPLAACYGHLALQAHVVPAPRSLVHWGGVAVGLGFVLLIGSLFASYRLRGPAPD